MVFGDSWKSIYHRGGTYKATRRSLALAADVTLPHHSRRKPGAGARTAKAPSTVAAGIVSETSGRLFTEFELGELFAERAAICRNRNGNPEPDPELRDTESVPLTEAIEDLFDREVRPHAALRVPSQTGRRAA